MEKNKITIKKLLENFSVLKNNYDKLNDMKASIKFKYAFLKNYKKLESVYNEQQEILRDTIKPSSKMLEFEQKRIQLINEYGEKDDKGEVKKDRNGVAIIDEEKIEEFNEKIKQLTEEYKDIMEERDKQIEEYEKLLNEEIEIEIHKINMNELPEDLPLKVFEALMEFNIIIGE